MKNIVRLFVLVALLSFQAHGEEGGRKGGGECKQKVKEVCGNVQKGEGRIKKCIEENMSSFSEKCQQRLSKRMEKRAEKRGQHKACREEAKKVCGDTQKGDGKRRACMEQNMSSFSEQCQKVFSKMGDRLKKRKACKEEVKKLCPGMKKGDGQLRSCMEEKRSQLSAECQKMGKQMKNRRERRKNRRSGEDNG